MFKKKLKLIEKKKTHRGKKIRNIMEEFVVLYTNINGIRSKLDSLREILSEKKPAVVLIAETKLEDDIPLIDGYENYPLNRKGKGGGVMILINKKLANITMEISEETQVGEQKWVTIDNGRAPGIRVGVLYGPQDNKTKKKDLSVM